MLMEKGLPDDAKALLKTKENVTKYAEKAQNLKAISNSTLPPEERLKQLANLGAGTIKNPLSEELTKTAVGAVVNINKASTSALQRELDKFSDRAAQRTQGLPPK